MNRRHLFLTGWLVFFILGGCTFGLPASQVVPTPTDTWTVTAPTSSPAPSITPPLTPTWTPLPTLSHSQVRDLIQELLRTNGGCDLPCWWGLIPGKTNWHEAENLLLPLGAIVHSGGVLGDAPITSQPDQSQYYGISIPSTRGESYASDLLQDYTIKDNIIVEIEAYNYDFAPFLSFPEFIKVYGKPAEVWIRTYSNDWAGIQPFEIILFYPDKGILIEYPAGGGISTDQTVQGCFKNAKFPFLYLWQPEPERTFDDVSNRFLSTKNWKLLPLSKATGMNVEVFYQMIIVPNSSMCIETSSDLWPEQ